MSPTVKGAAVLVFLTTIALAIVFGGALLLAWFDVDAEIGLPIISIAGVLLLLGALALVAVAFAGFDLQDKTQALGLPEGSIRAVIALSLILLFAILAIYLFNSISSPNTETIAGLSKEERDAFVADLPKSQILGITIARGTAAEATSPAAAEGTPAEGTASPAVAAPDTYSITIMVPRDPATDGFAKELLILLGTLVTSIASFYFGTKATAPIITPGAAQTATPRIDRVTPGTLKADGSSVDFRAAGSNLAGVRGVNVASGADEIAATNLNANDRALTFKLAIPTGKPAGAWDVMLVDAAGETIKAATITVTA